MIINDSIGAFIPGARIERPALGAGALSGLTFAVKDLFDVVGADTTYGNPDWAATHPCPVASAPIVTALSQAGAFMAGKTRTHELAYGLTGENVWHGTPINPAAPDRFPGGSSCGSAAAVAGALVDFALGSDTGGSVRIPASYCGLYGIRPTHGAISLAGACPLAPSLDTPGWFTRSAELLERIGAVLLPGQPGLAQRTLIAVQDAWENADPAVSAALRPALTALERAWGPAASIRLLPEGPSTVYDHFRFVQAEEAWAALGPWIEAHAPRMSPSVRGRFAVAKETTPDRAGPGRAFRQVLQARVRPLLAGGVVLVYPTSPCPAPLLTADDTEQDRVRQATIAITAIAGFCGLPEVTLPAGTVDGAPVGLSLVGGVGSDRALLALAREAAGVLGLAA
ncbi:MAG: amidase [Acetobacteraceae bacterium]